LFLPENEDPDSLVRKEGKTAFEKRLQSATTIGDFLFQHLSREADMQSTDGRARFVKLASDLLKNVPPGIFQEMMWEDLAKRARIHVDHIRPPTLLSSTTAPVKAPIQQAKQPSALRLALALLIQHPFLVKELSKPLPNLTIKGFDLLIKMVGLTKKNPQITTGMLVEQWRGTEEEPIIAKLSVWEHLTPETGLVKEFQGSIQNLHNLERKQIIEGLLAKASLEGLSPEEKQCLTQLIHDKS
jgi:DNA primase